MSDKPLEQGTMLEIRFEEGRGGHFLLREIGEAIVNISKTLVEVEMALHGESKNGTKGFALEAMQSSNPTLIITGANGEDKSDVFNSILEGTDAIAKKSTDDIAWLQSESALIDYRNLLNVTKSNGRKLTFSSNGRSVNADIKTWHNTETKLHERQSRLRIKSVLGEVKGKLELIDIHNGNKFAIWQEGKNQRIECHFEAESIEQVKTLLDKEVSVNGEIILDQKGEPRSFSQVRSIEEVEPPQAGNLLDLFGSVPDIMGGMTTEEYLRVVRYGEKDDDEGDWRDFR